MIIFKKDVANCTDFDIVVVVVVLGVVETIGPVLSYIVAKSSIKKSMAELVD